MPTNYKTYLFSELNTANICLWLLHPRCEHIVNDTSVEKWPVDCLTSCTKTTLYKGYVNSTKNYKPYFVSIMLVKISETTANTVSQIFLDCLPSFSPCSAASLSCSLGSWDSSLFSSIYLNILTIFFFQIQQKYAHGVKNKQTTNALIVILN